MRSFNFLVRFELPSVYFATTEKNTISEAAENNRSESILGSVAELVLERGYSLERLEVPDDHCLISA